MGVGGGRFGGGGVIEDLVGASPSAEPDKGGQGAPADGRASAGDLVPCAPAGAGSDNPGNQPLVTVIMTVYNGERYLPDAIESIRNQTLRDLEFIIVDDGSDDHTPEILAEAQTRDPRIRVISRGRLGRQRALNVAWRQAAGRYVANLDADDMAQPERLQKQVAFLLQHRDVGLLGTRCHTVSEEAQQEAAINWPLDDASLRRRLVELNPFAHSSVMMPRDVLEATGGYDESFHSLEDYELWVRIALHYKLANLPEPLAVKRIHRHAYFANRVCEYEKDKARIRIRWFAWRKLSRDVRKLRFILHPIVRGLCIRTGIISRGH